MSNVTFCYLYFKRRNKCIKAHEEAIVDKKYRYTDELCKLVVVIRHWELLCTLIYSTKC